MDKHEFTKRENISLKDEFGIEPNFSKWLASSDGIEYIKDALGVELIADGTEVKPNDKFSTDILLHVDPQYTNDDPPRIVIENQYGRSDHEHFSKLITYAVTNEAKYAVWILEDLHPEHKQAINWLNENTNENMNFYVFKAVIEKGETEKEFKLICLCEPDEERKLDMTAKKTGQSELNKTQLSIWSRFSDFLYNKRPDIRRIKPLGQHWCDIRFGMSQGHISVCWLSQESRIRFDFWIGDYKKLYDDLYLIKDEIEKTVGRTLIWDRKDGSKASSISYEMPDEFNIRASDKYDEYFETIFKELNDHFFKIIPIVKRELMK